MKKMFKFFALAIALVASTSFTSCSNDDPNSPDTPDVPKLPNEFVFDNTSTELKSMVIDPTFTAGITYIFLSPEAGLTTIDEVMETDDDGVYLHKYLMIAVPTKNITNTNIDVMTETESFSFTNLSGVCENLTMIMPGMTDEVSAGSIKVIAAADILTVDFSFDVVAGGTFKGHCSGAYETPVVPTTDITTLNGDVLPVKSAFYEDSEVAVSLYLTPSKISSAIYLEDVDRYYTCLRVDNGLMTGEAIDITKTQKPFEFTLCIPSSGEKFIAETNELNGATGTIQVAEGDTEGTYMIKFDITISGYHIQGDYDGAFVVYDLTIPNQYIINDEEPVAIKSVVVDKANESLYSIYVSGKAGVTTVDGMKTADAKPIIVTANPTNFTGDYLGFSGYPEVSITCNGILHNDATGKRGNTKITLNTEKISIDFELFKFEDADIKLKGHYEGAYTAVQ